jgi:hypothetical protein
MVVRSMIEMGVDIVYPIELPSQASLTMDGQNCFEPIVCKCFRHWVHWVHWLLLTLGRFRIQRVFDRIHT